MRRAMAQKGQESFAITTLAVSLLDLRISPSSLLYLLKVISALTLTWHNSFMGLLLDASWQEVPGSMSIISDLFALFSIVFDFRSFACLPLESVKSWFRLYL